MMSTDAKTILDAGAAIGSHMHVVTDDDDFVIVPNGWKLEDLEPWHVRPRRRKAVVACTEIYSFERYWSRFADERSVIYWHDLASPPRARAVLDNHTPDAPEWGDHLLTFQPEIARQWKTWTAANDQQLTQQAFGEFVEDNLVDVYDPDGARLLEVVRNLEATKNVAFKSFMRVETGDVNFGFSSETKGSGSIDIPSTFVLRIPVFERADVFELVARLRYRITDDGKLSLRFVLLRPDDVLRAAVDVFADQFVELAGESFYRVR